MKQLLFTYTLLFTVTSFAQVPNYVPTNGLVGWWGFNGNANDESGNGNNGTVNGATLTTDRFGNPNSAYSFDGLDDFLSLASGAGSQLNIVGDISCSFWLNTSQTTPFAVITIGDNVGVDGGFLVDQIVSSAPNNNPDKVSIWTANQWVSSQTIWNDGITNFFCITLESGVLKLFKNGALDTTIINQPSVSSYSGNRFFGVMSQGNQAFLNGVLDDIGLWNRALTACEISELYHAQQFTPPVLAMQDTLSACGASTTLDAGTDPTWASYLWNTTEDTQTISVSNSGLYAVEVTDTNGCIGYDTTLVSLLQSTTGSITESNCDTYTAPDGQTYTSSGNYTAVIPNAVGCDSTITIDLTITNSNSSSETVTECDSYTWSTNGQTYTQSGQYTEVLTNQNGCDSTVTLDLTINSSSSSSQTDTGLDSYTWSVNNQTYTQSGTYTAVIPNASGCDSTITLDLTLQFTGLNENKSSYVAVYPNPTYNSFTLSTKDMIHMNYTLVDLQGKVVLTGKIESTEETVDISKLSKGQYNLVFEDESISPISIIKN